jgi:hypothetical protein
MDTGEPGNKVKYVVETNKPAVKAREEWLLEKESSAPGQEGEGRSASGVEGGA